MKYQTSPATGKKYPVHLICRALKVARSTCYRQENKSQEKRKRGPKTLHSDGEIVEAIRDILNENTFAGEGYRKTWARLRFKGFQVGQNRVLRLMRENGLLAPSRKVHRRGNRAHDGTIITDRPDELWGADATTFTTVRDGNCWIFATVDHFNSEVLGINVSKSGKRFEAIESLRQGVSRCFCRYDGDAARGLKLRFDHGSQYMSRDFQGELKYLGIEPSPTFVGEPQGNGVVERFFKTLKEQCLWVHRFETVEEAAETVKNFVNDYNNRWIMHRLNYKTPKQARISFYEKEFRDKAA